MRARRAASDCAVAVSALRFQPAPTCCSLLLLTGERSKYWRSYWRTKEHPDPDGETLDLVISSLEQRWKDFTAKGVTDLGLIVDWCALWQAPRETPEIVAAFVAGLKGINLVSAPHSAPRAFRCTSHLSPSSPLSAPSTPSGMRIRE